MKRASGLLLVLTIPAFGAFERLPHGAREITLGGASAALHGNPWGTLVNPSLAATATERLVSFSAIPARFGLPELSEGSLLWVEPAPFGGVTLSVTRFGFDLYRELTGRLAYGIPVSDDAALGVSVSVASLVIAGYGSAHTVGLDVGGVVDLSGSLRWGFAAYNVNGPSIGAGSERLPQGYVAGVACRVVDRLVVVVDLHKDLRHPMEINIGVEYRLLDPLSLRCGMSQNPSSLSGGCGLRVAAIEVDYAFSRHLVLGTTHAFSLSFYPGRI